MGRKYNSVYFKTRYLLQAKGLCKGKFTDEENERVKRAVENNENYLVVAKEMNREPKSVCSKMRAFKSNPKSLQGKTYRAYSLGEDFLIIDKVIPRLKHQKLSSTGFLSQSDSTELATEMKRTTDGVKRHWYQVQRWLLQHYTGTSGFRVEKMLTSLVAEKYKDHRGIDWEEILNQHKEFVGHTRASISVVFQHCLKSAKIQKQTDTVSLQEVAECSVVYQAKKEHLARTVHKEKVIEYFKKRVEELGITVVV